MATIREYFDIDFGNTIKVKGKQTIRYQGREIEVLGDLCFDFTAGCLFKSYYISENDLTLPFFVNFLDVTNVTQWDFYENIVLPDENLQKGIVVNISNTAGQGLESDLDIRVTFPGGLENLLLETRFYGRIFIYCESELSLEDMRQIKLCGNHFEQNVEYRSHQFSKIRSMEEKPLAFISHDSRDKTLIARDLANKLQSLNCPVWYDEFSLNVGDSLRESIEEGIKKCGKCILVLTPNFLSNGGWTKTEFNSIFTRQILEEQKLVLPIWSGIDKKDVYNYSPSPLDVVGVDWDLGVDEVSRKLLLAIKGKSN